jgi:hypothetical protein
MWKSIVNYARCYGQNVMSEGPVRRWDRMLKNWGKEKMFTLKSEVVVDIPSIVSESRVQNIDQKLAKDGASRFQNVHVNLQKYCALFSARLLPLRQAGASYFF